MAWRECGYGVIVGVCEEGVVCVERVWIWVCGEGLYVSACGRV